jgi:hypothetical protein
MRNYRILKHLTITILATAVLAAAAPAQQVSRDPKISDQVKGLDEQVQEIKTDVLAIAAELNQLEEKLLFPSNTQVALFVSLADGETFRLDAVQIQLDGQPVAHHIYTFKELEALRMGGVQRIYTGNIRAGGHDLQVTLTGKSATGADIRATGQSRISKDVGPAIVEISLAAQGVDFKAQTIEDR